VSTRDDVAGDDAFGLGPQDPFHDIPALRGGGSIPASCRIDHAVLGAIAIPTC
jgi:hypothetical protein